MTTDPPSPHVVLLAGGVGGARLADGLARALPPDHLTVVVNTGDDFRHLGLTICPDLDTVTYMLAGVNNDETGWGRVGESWRALDEAARLGGPDWFRLGDLDLATHLARSHWLAEGETLTAVTRRLWAGFGAGFGAGPVVLPMSDAPAPTLIETDTGDVLPFQIWFVRERWQPAVRRVVLPEDARATAAVIRALEAADVVIIAPSNPFVSIDPILNAYPIRALIEDVPQAVVAVSPIIAGQALKGPAAKMMAELGLAASAAAVAGYYGHLIDGFVYDQQDAGMTAEDGLALLCTDTIMRGATGRERLAREVLAFAGEMLD
ncbi:MAG: 2-phospho-L-lactate transferase [Candidatus Promineofilum sp.]|nr:2-phospho-L-lactate transferase [Promineifilum sp.]MCW5862625.1 2-phospho-L-lactate transferase [Anaerolineae bacterium]